MPSSTDDAGRILLCRIGAVGRCRATSGRCRAAGCDFGEPPEAAVVRELEEEAGYDGEVVRLVDVSDRIWPTSVDGVRTACHPHRLRGPDHRRRAPRRAATARPTPVAGSRPTRRRTPRPRRSWPAHALALSPAAGGWRVTSMHSTIGIDVAAPPELVFALARDVERWERLLPHYARSRAVERRADGSLVVDFVARRPLIGVLGLGLPVAWRSRTWTEPATRRLRFVHVAGATRGMDVTWRIEPTAGGCRVDDRARLRAAASPSFAVVRRPLVHATDRRPDAGDVQGPRRGARRARAVRIARADESTDMTDRRRVWITGIGIITAIGTGRRRVPGRAAGRPLAGQADRPLRPEPVPLAGRGPGRRLRPARLDAAQDRPPARPVQPVRAGRRAARARRRGAAPGRGRRPRRPQRIGIYLGSALGGIAYAEEQHERYLEQGHPPGRAEPRPRGVRRRGAGQPRHRARRARADPVDRQLVRVGCGRARRGARATCARAGSTPRSPAAARSRCSPLAFGAFDIIRALSAGHNDDAGHGRPAVRRRPRRVRHGRGRGAARARGRRRSPRRAARRRTPSCSATARRPTPTTWSSRGPTAARRRGRRRSRSTTPASSPARSTTSTRTPRRRRSATSPRRGRSRLALGERAATVPVSGTKALYGHPLGASGAIEAAICALGDPRRLGAGVGQPRRARSRTRRRSCRACCARAATAPTGACCRPRSGSAA